MNILKLAHPDSEVASVLFGLCRDYNINIVLTQGSVSDTDIKGVTVSPLDVNFGIVQSDRTLLVSSEAEPTATAIFHEIVHIILGPESQEVDEAFVLISFQQVLAEFVSRRLSRSTAANFLSELSELDANYEIADRLPQSSRESSGVMVEHIGYGKWYRNGVVRAKEMGVLTHTGLPSWKFADWSAFDVDHIKNNWCLKTDGPQASKKKVS